MCPPAHPPAHPPSERWGEGKAMLAPVTEWVLAGQQTIVCKHHRETPVDTRLFIEFFVVCKHFLKTDPQRLSKVKKKMPFPSWVEGEGKDRGQFILLSDSLSSTGCPRGGPFSGSQCRRVPCSLWCPKLSSVQCPRSLLPGTGAGCPCVGRKKSVPLHLDERCRSISPWQQRVSP